MKKHFLILIVLTICTVCSGELSFSSSKNLVKSTELTDCEMIATLDIDHDGNLDFVAYSTLDIKLYLVKNFLSETNSTITNLNNGARMSHMSIVDLNNDGTFELIYIDTNKQLSILHINANSNYIYGVQVLSQLTNYDEEILNYEIADLNNDGLKDIIYRGISGSCEKFFTCIQSSSEFSFTSQLLTTFHPSYTISDFKISAKGDLNNDNFTDFCVSYRTHNSSTSNYLHLDIFLNNGDGSFSNSYNNTYSNKFYRGFLFHDIDNDGFNELAFSYSDNGGSYSALSIEILDWQDSSFVLVDSYQIPELCDWDLFSSFKLESISDLNNDGFYDFVLLKSVTEGEDYTDDTQKIEVVFGSSGGLNTSNRYEYLSIDDYNRSVEVSVFDYDLDNCPEILYQYQDSVYAIEMDTTVTFLSQMDILDIKDVNGDSNPDLIPAKPFWQSSGYQTMNFLISSSNNYISSTYNLRNFNCISYKVSEPADDQPEIYYCNTNTIYRISDFLNDEENSYKLDSLLTVNPLENFILGEDEENPMSRIISFELIDINNDNETDIFINAIVSVIDTRYYYFPATKEYSCKYLFIKQNNSYQEASLADFNFPELIFSEYDNIENTTEYVWFDIDRDNTLEFVVDYENGPNNDKFYEFDTQSMSIDNGHSVGFDNDGIVNGFLFDFNNDGVDELYYQRQQSLCRREFADTSQLFSPEFVVYTPADSLPIVSNYRFSDIDSDGQHDILFVSNMLYNDRYLVAAYYNNEDFSNHSVLIHSDSYDLSFDILDFNNNGDSDIVLHSRKHTYKTSLIINDNGVNFNNTLNITPEEGYYIPFPLICDIDQDNDFDAVQWIPEKFSFKWIETFTQVPNSETSAPPFSANITNYPNPFNPSTNISFNIKEDTDVEITIYNMKGQKVKTLVDEKFEQGQHKVEWNGTDSASKSVGSGVYFYKVDYNGRTQAVKKCVMLK